jgi:hypothetical protein
MVSRALDWTVHLRESEEGMENALLELVQDPGPVSDAQQRTAR